jgi:carbonic anhydrase
MKYTWQIRSALIGLVLAVIAGPIIWALIVHPSPSQTVPEPPLTDPAAIFAELEAGNARFVASHRVRSIDTQSDAANRLKLEKTQQPFVLLLTCSDSRIGPEFAFDQHIGSIFVVRNAGNVVENVGLGSLEYGVEHLHTSVLVVLGHKGCGAIKAVNAAGDEPLPHHLKDLQQHMAGLKPSLRPKDADDAFLSTLTEINARQQAAQLLAQSEVLRKAVETKQLIVAAALYDLESGEVKFLDKNVKGP